MTLARNPELANCPTADFVRCVLEAAEIGLAIDGKLCYVVRYKSTWQCQPDYKGLIAVAKRSGQIKDCYGDVVHESDTFHALRKDDRSELVHQRYLSLNPGEVYAAYAIVKLPDGAWRYELMTRAELDAIQQRAPAKKGPWATDLNEMRKKTVIRRALKLYCDDPGFIHAAELADGELELSAPAIASGPPVGRTRLGGNGQTAPPLDHYQRDEPGPESVQADTPAEGNGEREAGVEGEE